MGSMVVTSEILVAKFGTIFRDKCYRVWRVSEDDADSDLYARAET